MSGLLFWPVKLQTRLNTLEVPLELRDISNWDSNLDFADENVAATVVLIQSLMT